LREIIEIKNGKVVEEKEVLHTPQVKCRKPVGEPFGRSSNTRKSELFFPANVVRTTDLTLESLNYGTCESLKENGKS